ncbi:putative reverse transcriptase domain-containing protein [Tanacetum coccineum]
MLNPITSLTKRNQKYEWSVEQEEAFQTLKNNLLSLLDGVEDFVVYCDASNHRLANVVVDALSGKERVKPKRVRAMAMTIQSGVKEMILAAQGGVRIVIMDEAHNSRYSVHPGADKMLSIKDLRAYYNNQRYLNGSGHDVIWVVVDRLTKLAHVLVIREDYSTEKLARLYTDEIVTRHGVSVSIILDRNARFTSRLWQTFQKALGTRLDMSMAYHPQTDGQSERTIQTLEDMLRACVIDFGGS